MPPQFTITKSATPGTVSRGDNTLWTVRVENSGRTPGINFNVVDVLPAGLVYVRGTSRIDGVAVEPVLGAPGSYPRGDSSVVTGRQGQQVKAQGEVMVWTIESLKPGEELEITFFAQATVGVTPGQTLINDAYVYDPKWPDD